MPSTPTFLDRYIAALRYRDFRWVWLGAFSGQSAYWALIVARGILVLNMTGSSSLVGITTFAAMVPRFIMPPLTGYLADRFDRRNLLAMSYTLQFGHSVILSALALTGVIEVWHIMVLAVANGTFRTFQMTASQALVPNLIPREHLLNAVALNQLSQQGSRLVGPGIVAPALLIAGPDAAFAISTLFYATGIFGVLKVRTRSSGNLKPGASIGSSMVDAASFVWHQPQLRSLFALVALHCSMTMAFESMLPVFARDVLTESKAGVSYLMMGAGGGAVVAVILIAGYRGEVGRGRLLLALGTLSGAAMLALAGAPTLTTAIAAMALMGGSQAGFMAISGAMVQSLAPDEMRGRISGLHQINVGGTMALVNLVNGFAADAYGAPAVLVVMGLSFISVMTLSLAFGTVRGVYSGSISLRTRTA